VRQLTSLDTQFLALESERQVGHVASLAILDTSTAPNGSVGCRELKALFRERLPLLPPLRWRLTEVPFNLDYPYWTDDTEFDLDYHVREIALPRPGSDAQLSAQVARIVERPLDRTRPLWETYVIEGLQSGQTAVLTKIHHAVVDGLSGAEILGILLDLDPDPSKRELPAPDGNGTREEPGQAEMLARGLLGLPKYPLRVIQALPRTLPNVDAARGIFGTIPGADTVGRVAATIEGTVRRDLPSVNRKKLTAPKTPFNGRVTRHRRFTFFRLPLDDVKAIKNRHGYTVNDVVVSMCAGAVRRWLIAHDALPDEPLVSQVPVSVRSDEEFGTYGNRILMMAAPLYTDVEDPLERLRLTHEAMVDMKQHHKALPANLLQDANHFVPPAVFHRAAQLTFRVATSRTGRPNWNLVISNVPGPQFPLYLAGARLVANYPASVITDGMGLNITVMSYCGCLDFGIVADRDQMPDLAKLPGYLRRSLDELAHA
jgi:diacylglycerol O-acyltransferase / wax synthase